MMLSHQDALKLASNAKPLRIQSVQTGKYQWQLLITNRGTIEGIHAKDHATLMQTLSQSLAYHPDPVSIDDQPIAKMRGLPPAGASTVLKEEYGYRSHVRDWQTLQGHAPVDESLGLFAGGVLITAEPAGRMSYHHRDTDSPNTSPCWAWARQFLLTTRNIVTRPELERFSEEEYNTLRLTALAPEWIKDKLAHRGELQRRTAETQGLTPRRETGPVFTKVIADTGSNGYPYSNGPSIFVHGNPVIMQAEAGQPDPFDGPTTVAVAEGLYRSNSRYIPVDPRWSSDPEALKSAQRITAVRFDHAAPESDGPVRRAEWITMTAGLTGVSIDLAVPYMMTDSDTPLGLEVVYNPALTTREEMASAMTRALWEGSSRIPKNIALEYDENTRARVDQALASCQFMRE